GESNRPLDAVGLRVERLFQLGQAVQLDRITVESRTRVHARFGNEQHQRNGDDRQQVQDPRQEHTSLVQVRSIPKLLTTGATTSFSLRDFAAVLGNCTLFPHLRPTLIVPWRSAPIRGAWLRLRAP